MPLELREEFLAGSGAISVQFFLTPSEERPYLEILVVRYTGSYPVGSAGNTDAMYMYAMAKAAVAAFEPWGVIHDLSELNYEWGDMLEMVFGVGPEIEQNPVREIIGSEVKACPVAVVVGPGCEEAVRTLCHGINSNEPIDTLGWVFRDLPSAWRFVADGIG